MTPNRFRELALSLPETPECGHSERPDYRVRGKTFATLFPVEQWGVAELTRALQAELLNEEPVVFEACTGAWGRNGATVVFVNDAEEGSILRALIDAWSKHVPLSLTEGFDNENA